MPVTVIGDRAIGGFNPNQLSEALGLGVRSDPRDPAETIPLLARVLDSLERAIRQMPDDKLDWRAPDRDRPMREFTYHISRMIRSTIRGLQTGVYETPGSADEEGLTYNSFQGIAEFCGTVTEEYKAWASKQDIGALKTLQPVAPDTAGVPSTGAPWAAGQRTGAERLDLIAGHSIQHLRQVYWVLEQFGITPKDRMADSEFPQEYVLTLISPTGGLF